MTLKSQLKMAISKRRRIFSVVIVWGVAFAVYQFNTQRSVLYKYSSASSTLGVSVDAPPLPNDQSNGTITAVMASDANTDTDAVLPVDKYGRQMWWVPLAEASSASFQPKSWWTDGSETNHSIYSKNRCSPKLPGESELKLGYGLVFIKVFKAASSTLRGVNRAISHHMAKRLFDGQNDNLTITSCRHDDDHSSARNLNDMVRDESFLWSFIRNPRSRDLSQFYHFSVTRMGRDPYSDDAVKSIKRSKNAQTKFMLHGKRPPSWNSPNITSFLRREIMEKFDFIGVTERMTESLAVLTLLWDLDPTDVIVLGAKQATGDAYDDGKYKSTCFKLVPAPKKDSDIPPKMAQYLNSPNHTEGNLDFLLYAAVNRTLDNTIHKLGPERVRERGDLISKLQSMAEKECQEKAVFPCSSDGVRQRARAKWSCYVNDSGCGHKCVDAVLSQYRQVGDQAVTTQGDVK
mmetsp:Transcript_61709/g.177659  ORF Transcript_61709/g.177659 Transcript_61709/m.177659 type:complete len:460 (+) Transcript_61709:156-1535(+)